MEQPDAYSRKIVNEILKKAFSLTYSAKIFDEVPNSYEGAKGRAELFLHTLKEYREYIPKKINSDPDAGWNTKFSELEERAKKLLDEE